MGEHVTSGPPEATSGSSGHHPSGDERADAALRQLVRLLARIAVAEALGTADLRRAAGIGSPRMSRLRTPAPASERLLTIADVAEPLPGESPLGPALDRRRPAAGDPARPQRPCC